MVHPRRPPAPRHSQGAGARVTQDDATGGTRSGLSVGAASLVAAAAGYGVLVLAARNLDKSANADFLACWAALFTVFGVLAGVQNEITRSVFARSRPHSAPTARDTPRVVLVGAFIGCVLALAFTATAFAWGAAVLGESWRAVTALSAIGIASFAVHVSICGALTGRRRWSAFASLVAGESVARLLCAALVAFLGGQLVGYVAATVAATITWLVWTACSTQVRHALAARADVPMMPLLAGMTHACAAAAASAVLVVGFPVLIRLFSTNAEYAEAAPLILALAITRGPVMIPLGAYQGAAITWFASREPVTGAAARRVGLRAMLAAVAGSGAAALLGPVVMETIRHDYDVAASTFAALVFGVFLLGALTLTGAATLALARHRAYSVGWIAATLAAMGCLAAAPGSLDMRVSVALVLGPLAGLAIHLWSLRRPQPMVV